MNKEEKKDWKNKEIVSLGEAILVHYGIGLSGYLAFELEQLIDGSLYFSSQRDKNITSNWIRQLFDGKTKGDALSDAFLGVCYELGALSQRDFIEVFDYLGICQKLIEYWKINQCEKETDTADLSKFERERFDDLIKSLQISIPNQVLINKQIKSTQIFYCEDHMLHELSYDRLTEGIVKLYGALLQKSSEESGTKIKMKDLPTDTKIKSILNQVEKITGEVKKEYLIKEWIKSTFI